MLLLHLPLQVTPESLLLHYYSPRPGLWPIVVGVLKGVAAGFFSLQLQVELLHSRERGDSDHEVGLRVQQLCGVVVSCLQETILNCRASGRSSSTGCSNRALLV